MAPLALLAVLLGGNALVAQVEDDLQAQLDGGAGGGEEAFESPDSPPLKLNNLKLPEDVLSLLPPGTKLDPDMLNELELPEGMKLDLPEGFDLSDLDFDLPPEFDLDLPAGSSFDPRTGNLSLPGGGRIRLPDGKSIDLPPGTNLTLPPVVARQLLDQGMPAGPLPVPRSFHLRDVPAGTTVTMDPPRLRGNGTLDLPPGTKLRLPDGVEVPPEALLGLVPFLLPEGTEIVTPPGGSGDWTLPEPADGETPAPVSEVDPGIAVATDIDTWPARVPKGEAFVVEGYVREAHSGRDVAGAPVRIYMNETKAAPGVLVGTGMSDERGRFAIEVAPPSEKPARQWQLVNHAVAFVDAAGIRYASGWGDPPFETFASTRWASIEVPAQDGLQSATAIRGTLVDDTGAPVPLARVEVLVNGGVVRHGTTGADGVFATTYVFTTKGEHTVRLRFPGNSYYEPSDSEARTVRIEDVAIDIAAAQRVERGDRLAISGRVLVSGIASPGKSVDIEHPFGGASPIRLVTDGAGRFAASVAVPATTSLGEHTLRYRAPEYGVVKEQRVDVWTAGRIVLEAPAAARIDLPLEATAMLVDRRGDPIPGQSLLLSLTGPGGVSEMRATSSARPERVDLLPPAPAEGRYTLAARLSSTDHVVADPESASIVLGRLDVAWEVPDLIVRGSLASVTAAVTFADEPLAGAELTLGMFTAAEATTDALGRASWSVPVPRQAGLGDTTVTLTLPAHRFVDARTTTIQAIPTLTIAVPAEFAPGEPVTVSALLVDDLGVPLAGHPVGMTLRAGSWTHIHNEAVTDADGRANATIRTEGAPRETMAMSAVHEPRANILAADAVASIPVAAGAAGAPDLSPLLWALPVVGLVAAGGAGAAVYRRRKSTSDILAAATPATAASVIHAPGFDLDVGIPAGEPLVWGLGEPLAITVTPTGTSTGRGSVRLTGGGMDATVPLEAGAEPRTVTARFDAEGDVELTAARADDALAAAIAVNLRVVDYRKEIAREFDLLLDRARLVEPTLDRQSTPQEVEWMLAHRLGAEASGPLAEMSLVMDVANYSPAPIARADWLRFLGALRALDAHLPGGRA